MTTFLRINLWLGSFIFLLAVSPAMAQEVPWRDCRDLSERNLGALHVVPFPRKLIAGVSPSIAQIVEDLKRSRPVRSLSRQGLADTLAQMGQGKEGPLLVVSDGNKIRVMELKVSEVLPAAP